MHGRLSRPASGNLATGGVNRSNWSRTSFLLGAFVLAGVTPAQNKTGPALAPDDSLTWHGVTLYGVVDIGLQYETHGAPFSDFHPAGSANIVQKNSRQSVLGATPSNMGQSRIGLQGIKPLAGEWSAVWDRHSQSTGCPVGYSGGR
jgi:hypothetical protein